MGRYLILMMGIFAVYCGFVYNDFFALSLDIMPGGSQWEFNCPCKPPTNTSVAAVLPWSWEECHASEVLSAIPTDGHCGDDLPNHATPWLCDPSCCCGGGDPSGADDHSPLNGIMIKGSIGRSKHARDAALPFDKNGVPLTEKHTMQGGFAEGYVYPFGLDPVWKGTSNELAMFNSFKMKVSVILGILQMVFGICLKGVNAILASKSTHGESMLDFWYEFLPQLMFSSGLFLYMIFMIFCKWSIDWEERMGGAAARGPCTEANVWTPGPDGCGCALGEGLVDPITKAPEWTLCQPPSLINTLINIALAIGKVDERLYESQPLVQTILLLVAVGSVPIMLLVKPYKLKWKYGKKSNASPELMHDEEAPVVAAHGGGHGHGDGEFNFAEIFIHSCIETIEFVLGMVSNTASYLRLWALSLAHSELALVFWEQLMVLMLGMGPVGAFCGKTIVAACCRLLPCHLFSTRIALLIPPSPQDSLLGLPSRRLCS
jgi:vacuolar-type H+-ATPase subunit I/STV1